MTTDRVNAMHFDPCYRALACALSLASPALAQLPFGPDLVFAGGEAWCLAVGDVDGDGRNDVVTGNLDGRLACMLATGLGRFEPAVFLPPSTTLPQSFKDVHLADIDGDHDLDVLGLTGPNSDILVYRNDGAGVFTFDAFHPVGPYCNAFETGDLDGDNRPDVVVSKAAASTSIRVLMNDGTGALASYVSYQVPPSGTLGELALVDVDGDLDLDVIAASYFELLVLPGTGTGAFGTALSYPVTKQSDRLAVGDWNGDQLVDAALGTGSGQIEIVLQQPGGAFASSTILGVLETSVVAIAQADLDGDAIADLATSNYQGLVRTWRGLGNGSFAALEAIQAGPRDLAFAEANGDQDIDLIAVRTAVQLLPGDGSGSLGGAPRIALSAPCSDSAIADLDQDGDDDLLSLSSNSASLDVRLAIGGGAFAPVQTFPLGAVGKRIFTGRLNNDSLPDVIVLGADDSLGVLLGAAGGNLGSWSNWGFASSVLAAGDVTGDGYTDVVHLVSVNSAGYLYYWVQVHSGNGTGGLAATFTLQLNTDLTSITIGDWNEDGVDDALLAGYQSAELLSNGAGGLVYVSNPSVGPLLAGAVADLDGDGHLDVLGTPTNPGFQFFRGDGLGSHSFAGSIPLGGGEAVMLDLDGDGDLDVLSHNGGSVTRLVNDGNAGFTDAGSFATLTAGRRIHVTDLDADGRSDLLISSAWLPECVLHLDRGVVPGPAVYCTAKTTSNGCGPAIAWSGTPSATATSGFTISCANAINNKSGMLFYSLSGRAASPFHGGTMCVLSPRNRTPLRNSGGNPPPDDCSGVFALDFNAFAHGLAGGTPSSSLTNPGTAVTVQWWGRDPAFAPPGSSMLSNALEFVIGP